MFSHIVYRDASRYLDLQPLSVPVAGLCSGADDANGNTKQAAKSLPLFEALKHEFASEAAKLGTWDGLKRRRVAGGQPAAGDSKGAVLNSGGPVWGLDWSAAMPAQHARIAERSSGPAAAASSRQDESGAAELGSRQFLAVRSYHTCSPAIQRTMSMTH
jgi:hypothetical protein